MSSEIEVPETPNWLQELEAKRERRLKARLGHEAGAGAPCLKCGEKCPGLDLHFWRKCCKICKCSKEEHEVQDDDIYGWAQFQLLGNKPSKIKRKIVLPGKNEVELDWTPKGHNETVDKYLKTLPPEQLPVKGSQAAQDRKQLLQRQIPIHDIDPTLCHELSNEELEQMNNYIAHVKQSSVGVGQIVSLSNIIKANLHMLNPSEAALIASRYPKGIPLAEIVKLQSENRANALKQQGLSQKLGELNLQDPLNKNLPSILPNTVNPTEEYLNPWVSHNIHDVNYPAYTKDMNKSLTNPQFSSKLKPGQNRNYFDSPNQNITPATTLDEKFLQNPNFDPKNIPSQFIHQNAPYPYKINQQNVPYDDNSEFKSVEVSDQKNSAFSPYKISSGLKPGEHYIEGSPKANTPGIGAKIPSGFRSGGAMTQSRIPGGLDKSYEENIDPVDPNFAKNLSKYPSGNKGAITQNFGTPGSNSGNNPIHYENIEELKKNDRPRLPNYAPGKYNVFSETHSPTKLPKNVKDLAFSTYNASDEDLSGLENTTGRPEQGNNFAPPNLAYENYPPGYFTHQNPIGNQYEASNERHPNYGKPFDQENTNLKGQRPGQASGLHNSPSKTLRPTLGLDDASNQGGNQNVPYGQYSETNVPFPDTKDRNQGGNVPVDHRNSPNGQNSGGFRSGQFGTPNNAPSRIQDKIYDRNMYDPTNQGDNLPNSPYGAKPVKKLSELQPGKIDVNEDYLQPSQVTIGAIQDINYPEIKAATQGTNDFYEDYSPDSLREILNNVKLPDCHYCKKPFEENEFAVTIDRANVLFHAQCFKCAGCNQILADNVYFYNKETDNVYCGRDYAKIRGFPRCKACDELIFTKEYCLAENSTFHLKHFCCIECDKPLAGQDYTLEDEMPYCLPCFEQSKASKCSSCGRIIKPDEIGCNLNGVHFHAVDECFACKICKKPLMGKKLLLRNEKLYCSHDCFGTDK